MFHRTVFERGISGDTYMMGYKEALTVIIKQKGNCSTPLSVSCRDCDLCKLVKKSDEKLVGEDFKETKYNIAIELFLETYTKEDLVEILI